MLYKYSEEIKKKKIGIVESSRARKIILIMHQRRPF